MVIVRSDDAGHAERNLVNVVLPVLLSSPILILCQEDMSWIKHTCFGNLDRPLDCPVLFVLEVNLKHNLCIWWIQRDKPLVKWGFTNCPFETPPRDLTHLAWCKRVGRFGFYCVRVDGH